jgi:hypothetical protein
MQPIRDEARQPGDGQHENDSVLWLTLGQRVERDRHGHHAERKQHVAEHVEARHRLTQVGHHAQRRDSADDTERQVDQEDPVPRGNLHEPTSKCRAHEWPDEAGDRHEAHGREEVLPRNDAEHGEPADWKKHRAADALQHTRGHELDQAS